MSDSSSNPAVDRPPSAETVHIIEFPSPGPRARQYIGRILFITVLFVGLVWGVREILHLNAPRPAPRPAPSAANSTCQIVTPSHPPPT
jgi:hypothetical protein